MYFLSTVQKDTAENAIIAISITAFQNCKVHCFEVSSESRQQRLENACNLHCAARARKHLGLELNHSDRVASRTDDISKDFLLFPGLQARVTIWKSPGHAIHATTQQNYPAPNKARPSRQPRPGDGKPFQTELFIQRGQRGGKGLGDTCEDLGRIKSGQAVRNSKRTLGTYRGEHGAIQRKRERERETSNHSTAQGTDAALHTTTQQEATDLKRRLRVRDTQTTTMWAKNFLSSQRRSKTTRFQAAVNLSFRVTRRAFSGQAPCNHDGARRAQRTEKGRRNKGWPAWGCCRRLHIPKHQESGDLPRVRQLLRVSRQCSAAFERSLLR